MAQGENAKVTNGKDWWGKRPLRNKPVSKRGMKVWKKILHGIERARAKQQLKKEKYEK